MDVLKAISFEQLLGNRTTTAAFAVHHDLARAVAELGQPAVELLDRNVDGAVDVPAFELRAAANIDEQRAFLDQLPGLVAGNPRRAKAQVEDGDHDEGQKDEGNLGDHAHEAKDNPTR